MNTDRELMQQALDALTPLAGEDANHTEQYAAYQALRERLAQPEQGPVAAQHRFRHPQKGTPDWSVWQPCSVSNRPAWEIDSQGYEVEYRALYATPPRREWVGLTDEEVAVMMMESWGCASIAPRHAPAFARAIETKLREKNT